MLLITNDDRFKKNNTKYLNMFFGYGYKYYGLSSNSKVQVFIYDISEYKDNPDWLNSKNWANPELWEKQNMKDAITDAISKGIKFDNLSVEGSESKYTVSIISNVFEGKSTIQRHKMIYALLDRYIKTGEIHALTIKAMTLDESKN